MQSKVCARIIFSVLLLVFSALPLGGKIVEVAHFKEVLDHIKPSTLLVVDIDDTLLVPVQSLGTDAWFMYRLEYHGKTGCSKEAALDKALAEWEAVRHLTNIKIVEEGSDKIIGELQGAKISIMGLTTQGLALSTRTSQHLRSVGIDLAKTAPSSQECFFMNGRLGVLFHQGILFTSGTKKGNAMKTFLELVGYQPERVVFINDKLNNLKDLEEGVLSMGIEFIGLRYSYEDKRVDSFNKNIADVQWARSSFNRILSDEEAMQFLNK